MLVLCVDVLQSGIRALKDVVKGRQVDSVCLGHVTQFGAVAGVHYLDDGRGVLQTDEGNLLTCDGFDEFLGRKRL